MTSVSVVLPTLPGREQVFHRVWDAYVATCPPGWVFDMIVPEGHDTVGSAWNEGMSKASCEYAFLASDDAEPHAGWAEVAVQTVDAGYVPAPRSLFADGRLESCGSMGFGILLPEAADMTPCRNTGQIFMRREWWDEVGEMPDRHYSCDDLWCWRAALRGYQVVYRSGMVFTHHHEAAATEHVRALAQEHAKDTIRDMARERIPGSRYAAIADASEHAKFRCDI